MPIFMPKSAPGTATKLLTTSVIQSATPKPVPSFAGDSTLGSMGTYHYAHSSVQRHSPAVVPPVAADAEGGVVQRQISNGSGDGDLTLYGRMVVDKSGNMYEIVGHEVFAGKLQYKLESEGGDIRLVNATSDYYDLWSGYGGVEGFTGRNEVIEFTVRRRDNSARTRTEFADEKQAIDILVNQCGVPLLDAQKLVNKADWSYPMVRQLMDLLSKEGLLQPGLGEGARLWTEAQPDKIYTIRTTAIGSQLAQLVGCHLMEYQETNNGTQGERQRKDLSRQKQLKLTRAILGLPEDEVAKHAIGLGQPQYINQFPAPFDIKFEGGPLFGRNAGTSTFKVYQSAIASRDQRFDYTHTLEDTARKDRKTATEAALKDTSFNIDQMKLSDNDDEFIHHQLGLKDTDSDYSMDEDEDWTPPLTAETVGSWTLEQLHEFVYKHNVYSGVLFKEYAAKQAELGILETQPSHTYNQDKLLLSKARRERVQMQILAADEALMEVLYELGIKDVRSIAQRFQQWKEKTELLEGKTSSQAQKYRQSLQEYGKKSLLTLQSEGYPVPLDGIGKKGVEEL